MKKEWCVSLEKLPLFCFFVLECNQVNSPTLSDRIGWIEVQFKKEEGDRYWVRIGSSIYLC